MPTLLTELLTSMTNGQWVAAMAGIVLGLAFVGVPYWVWTAFAGGCLFFCTAVLEFQMGPMAWAIFAVFAAMNIRPLRALLVSKIVFTLMKVLKLIPKISETERTALEAGNVWAEAELFSGKPQFSKMRKENYPNLTAEEQAFIDGPVEKLCSMINDFQAWQTGDLPEPVWAYLKKEKFWGMIIPKEYGGLGFTALAHSEVIMKLATRSMPLCITVMVPNSLGPAELLLHYGTEDQKKYYLPRLARGEELPCFALTEPTAGSDAGSIQASGVLFKDSSGKIMIRLNWNKRWITLAAVSTVLGLAFKLKDPDHLLGDEEDLGITCALIPSKTQGIQLGKRHDPLGVPFFNCPTRGKDVVIAIDAVVGGKEGLGNGWRMLMECLAAGRGISLPAQGTGSTKFAMRVASAFSVVRKQFGTSIGNFEGIEEPLARLGGFTYLMEAGRKFTLGALDRGKKPPVVTAIMKYQFSELSRKASIDLMDIMGGAGISCGPSNLAAHHYISSPIGITVEGANILTRTLIIFGQGALRAHPYAFKDVNAIEKNDLMWFDRAFWGHIGHVVRNSVRAFVLSVTRGYFVIPPAFNPLWRSYQKLAWSSASFAIMSDMAMAFLGGKLKMKEKLTGRFADILSWMYLAFAVMRRYEAEGCRKDDLPFAKWSLEFAFSQMQQGFDGIMSNFDVPGVGLLFKGPLALWSHIQSFGQGPSDKLGATISKAILSPGELRLRHSKNIFAPRTAGEPFHQLESAFEQFFQNQKIQMQLRKAVSSGKLPRIKNPLELAKKAVEQGVISQNDFEKMVQAEELALSAIQVDEFQLSEYKRGAA